MTPELHWVNITGEADEKMKETIVKKDSYSSDSLDECCEESNLVDPLKNNTIIDELANENYLCRSSSVINSTHDSTSIASQNSLEVLEETDSLHICESPSVINSIHDNTSSASQYSLEVPEETHSLQTDSITESDDICRSPHNPDTMSFDYSANFYSEFSLVATLNIPIPENHQNQTDVQCWDVNKDRDVKNIKEKFDINYSFSDSGQIKLSEESISNKVNEAVGNNIKLENHMSSVECDDSGQKLKAECYTTNVRLTKREKESSSIAKKIAEEIEDFKAREADLCSMRENLMKQALNIAAEKVALNKECMGIQKAGNIITTVSKHREESLQKEMTSKKYHNPYIKASVFAFKRKNVCGANYLETANKNTGATVHQESPIEREIRISKEREEELKRDREQILKSNLDTPVCNPELAVTETNMDSVHQESSMEQEIRVTKEREEELKRDRKQLIKPDLETRVCNPEPIVTETNMNFSHKTSLVEKEILIGKEREEDLKQDRKQAVKSRLETYRLNPELSQTETDVDSALSICSYSSLDSLNTSSPFFPGTISPDMQKSFSFYSSSSDGSICSSESNEKLNDLTLHAVCLSRGFSKSPSPIPISCKPVFPFKSPRAYIAIRNRSIDMERFISSKGKEIQFKSDSSGNPVQIPNFYEIRPPQIKKSEELKYKTFITAATKIQNELKEMQLREEQFRKERENHDTKFNSINHNEGSRDENEHSLPNISPKDVCDSEDLMNNMKQDSTNYTRRLSMLIDEWELKIQKSTLQA